MNRFLVLLLANMAVFVCSMIYGYWWYDNHKSFLVLLIFPMLFIGVVMLINFFIKNHNPELLEKYKLNNLLGTMSGQVIGLSFLWLIFASAN